MITADLASALVNQHLIETLTYILNIKAEVAPEGDRGDTDPRRRKINNFQVNFH